MSFADNKTLWERSLVQAYHFADTDNTLDALSRMRRLKQDVGEQFEQASDAAEKEAIGRFLARVEKGLVQIEKRYEAWRAGVEQRAADYEEAEQQAYDAPLRVKGI